ncbi:MAG: ATP-binding protein [Candidatus Microsaccharimonas sp.]
MQMFQSATLKLTAWYLAILMTISITFSIVIYQLNYREISFRLENLQHSLLDNSFYVLPDSNGNPRLSYGPNSPLSIQSRQAASQMALSLIYINIVVFVAGGLGSYFLARRTLRPIEESHEAQSRFTSDASHELRTPLATMKAELEVNLRDPNLSQEESRELLESNLEEVNKLIQLSEMLLQLSRLDHDKLERTPVDVVALLNDKMKVYKTAVKRFDITTRKKAVASANEPAISELIGILIDNALKYSPEASKITIRIFEKRGSVGFEIHNTGDPIPEEKLPKLFDRFFRADGSRTNSSQNGYGLGLSIAKKIIDVHHGTIEVSSSEDGTTFTFYLPIIRNNQA